MVQGNVFLGCWSFSFWVCQAFKVQGIRCQGFGTGKAGDAGSQASGPCSWAEGSRILGLRRIQAFRLHGFGSNPMRVLRGGKPSDP